MVERIRGRRLQERNRRFLSENPLCRHCSESGLVRPAAEVDHIMPLFKGGTDSWNNLQGLCIDCHKLKTAKDKGHAIKGCNADGIPVQRMH